MYQCFFVKFPFCSGSIKLYSPYLMYNEGTPDMPLLADGKIVFFKTRNDAIDFMRKHFRNVSYNDDPAYEFDTKRFIEDVRAGHQQGVVIDVLNIVFDYLSAIKAGEYPFFSRNEIFDFADYATFHREIGTYFKTHSFLTPNDLINFIHWFSGKITYHSIIYSRHTLPEIIRCQTQPLMFHEK